MLYLVAAAAGDLFVLFSFIYFYLRVSHSPSWHQTCSIAIVDLELYFCLPSDELQCALPTQLDSWFLIPFLSSHLSSVILFTLNFTCVFWGGGLYTNICEGQGSTWDVIPHKPSTLLLRQDISVDLSHKLDWLVIKFLEPVLVFLAVGLQVCTAIPGFFMGSVYKTRDLRLVLQAF